MRRPTYGLPGGLFRSWGLGMTTETRDPIQDVRFLLSFVPPWAMLEPEDGLPPQFYGTLTVEGDRDVVARVKAIRDYYDAIPRRADG